MNTQGFIKLPRAIIVQPWYKNNNAKLLFIHLLLSASFTDSPTAHRGEVVTSYPLLAEATGLSIHQVRNALATLIAAGMVAREGAGGRAALRTVLSVCNFDVYQGPSTCARQQNGQQNGQQKQEKKESNQRKKRNTEESLEEESSATRPAPGKEAAARSEATVPTAVASTPALVLTPPAPKRKAKKGFVPPTVDEVARYIADHHLKVDAQRFVDYYGRRQWRTQGRWSLIDWRAKLGDWDSREHALVSVDTSTFINPINNYSNESIPSSICGGYPRTTVTKQQANQYALDALRVLQQEHESRRRQHQTGATANG